jgi:RNA polymerase sigma-70 factor (ECF subfamily)
MKRAFGFILSKTPMAFDIAVVLERIRQGDETALAALYAIYGQPVYSLTLQVLRHPLLAQEATQDTFLKVWNNPRAYNPAKGQFGSWLLTLARYTAIDHLRREIRRTGRDVALADDLIAEENERLPEHETYRLHHLLGELPPEQRQLVEMAYFEGLTHSQMAEKLGLPLGTIKTRLRLGLQKLRGLLNS